jgi:hypothetical protein
VSDENAIPMLRPGETIGPFEIVIPREIVFLVAWRQRTSRWERVLLGARLMRKARRLEVYGRMRDLLPELD